jgi:predicted nuclease of predicted toxin-antitoxin system
VKILLDENLPHQLRLELPGHDVFATSFMGWGGIENGELLRRAATEQFDVLVTNDRGLEYQQNRNALPVAVVVLLVESNTIESIRPAIPTLLTCLSDCLAASSPKWSGLEGQRKRDFSTAED